ncbi:MAG: HAMP domain-containing sensor histidine kinase [Acidobacteriota bacterium]
MSSIAHRLRQLYALLPVLLLVALLALLATLQVRWLEQMRAADEERSRADLEARLGRVADDFNRQLGRLFLDMQPLRRRGLEAQATDLPTVLTELLNRWRAKADAPELVDTAYLLGPNGTAWRLDPATAIDPGAVPEPLRTAFEALENQRGLERDARREGKDRPRPGDGSATASLLLADVPALLIPLATPPGRFAESGGQDRRLLRHSRRRGAELAVAVALNRDVLLEELLPTLVESAFGPRPEYRLRLVDPTDGRIIRYLGAEADVGADGGPFTVDSAVEIFGPLAVERRSRGGRARSLRQPVDGRGLERGLWRLEANHADGSLDDAIAGAHRRNLALGLGILAVLGASLFVLSRGAARSRRLARQQLDFVAGITHELMTPLAALRSAGQNLADGVVKDEGQVRRYGRMIDREGHRLSDLVGQVLAFSRMQSGPPQFHRQPLDPAAEVHRVLDDVRPTLDAARVEPAVEIDAESGAVVADGQALRRALTNLVSNAVKYGQDPASPWLGVTVERRGGEVHFSIADRGPGISPQDLPHLFEPFVRGSGLAASHIPGSGLGLALVRHLIEGQGGRVDVRAGQPGADRPGAVFTLRLPAAEATAGREPS